MAASSSSPFFGIREEDFHIQMRQQQQPLPPHQLLHHHNQQQQQVLQLDHQQTSPPGVSTPSSSTAGAQQQGAAPQKKRRNVPGNQTDPDAEVIALSPKTLLATNRFICEVCNKGFQREQNLQLHRRGHNLPWKLKQKSAKDAARRKVYLCPEPTCVHHEPSRALGDLTGIKKHYCRKHGEKKWKCDKCSKRYAVQSDWKAHSKTCGTREYRCDCGTLFSRRDSFITHRAFCDALAQESVRLPTATLGPIANMVGGHQHLYGGNGGGNLMALSFPPHMKQGTVSTLHNNSSVDPLRLGDGASTKQFNHTLPVPTSGAFFDGSHQQELHGQLGQLPDFQGGDVNGFDVLPHTQSSSSGTTNATMFNLRFFSNSGNQNLNLLSIPDVFTGGGGGGGGEKPPSSLFSGNLIGCSQGRGSSTLYNNSMNETWSLPQMSATALLQKAAQMGSTMSCGGDGGGASGLLRNFGSSSSSSGRTIHYPAAYGGDGMRRSPSSQMDNEAHLDDLMNSLVGNTSHGGAGSSREQEAGVGFGAFRGTGGFRTNNVDDTKLQNTLTRDFLGVGAGDGIMRGGGGMPQREQRHLGPTGVPFDQDGKGGNWSMYGLIPRSEHQVE